MKEADGNKSRAVEEGNRLSADVGFLKNCFRPLCFNRKKGDIKMRLRSQELGSRNIIGARVEQKRKELGLKQKDLLARIQVKGIELNSSGLSKLEGQIRSVSDYELLALSEALGVSVLWLLGLEDD